MRFSPVAVVVLAVLESCSCKSLPCGGAKEPKCIDESTALAAARWNAEQQWFYDGRCIGPSTGRSLGGSWVVAHGIDFCSQIDFFDRGGQLVARRGCCEGECTDYGLVPPMRGAPHDVCPDVLPGLRDAGVAIVVRSPKFDLTVTAADGSVLLPESRRVLLSPGHYVASLTSGERIAFEVPTTGMAVTPDEPGLLSSCSAGSCFLGPKSDQFALQFIIALERSDGGALDTPSPWYEKAIPDRSSY